MFIHELVLGCPALLHLDLPVPCSRPLAGPEQQVYNKMLRGIYNE